MIKVWRIFLVVTVCFLLGCNSGHAYKVPTNSMEPTIKQGDSVIVDETYYSKKAVERYDLVLVKTPDGGNERYVRRVIGLPGEEVQTKADKIYVNGQEMKELFKTIQPEDDVTRSFTPDVGPLRIPEGEYFLLGDNRANSIDSRFWKPPTVNKKLIEGKITKIIHR